VKQDDVEGSEADELHTDFALVRSCVEPVAELTGESLDTFGIDVAYVTGSEPGQDYEAEVECWAWSRAEGTLSKSIAEDGLAAALEDHAEIGSLAEGDCFRFADADEDSFDIVIPTGCTESDAEVIEVLGSVELDGEYPGADAISADGEAGCADLAAATDGAVDPADVGFTFPTERSWEALGQRSVICLVEGQAAEQASDSHCLTVPEGSSKGTETDCSDPHNAEFMGRGEPPAGALPNEQTALDIVIGTICRPVAAAAIGVDEMPEYLLTGNPPEATLGAKLTEPWSNRSECSEHCPARSSLTNRCSPCCSMSRTCRPSTRVPSRSCWSCSRTHGVGAGHDLHGAVLRVHVVDGEPHGHRPRRRVRPVDAVLVEGHLLGVAR
jgi:hypothetical protein